MNTSTYTHTQMLSHLRCEGQAARVPFLPAIYEHKGYLIGETPSAIGRDAELLTRALLKEYEVIQPDALTVGVDVYNLEAESVGCEVTYYLGDDTSIPGIKPSAHALALQTDYSSAPLPNPLKDGRMPVNLTAARNIKKEFGDSLWIRGALSGPFSLGVSLVGAETLFIGCLDNPEATKALLQYAVKIIQIFGDAYLDAGVELILFDSQASPELLSPDMYEEFVLPVTREIISYFKKKGVNHIPLVIGGNTTPILDSLVVTGANNLLSDFTSDFDEWKDACREGKRAVRRNISPHLVEKGKPDELYQVARDEIERGKDLPGFILGTAVVPYGSPTENLKALRQACLDAAR